MSSPIKAVCSMVAFNKGNHMSPIILILSIGITSLKAVELETPHQRILTEQWAYPQPGSPLLSSLPAMAMHYNTQMEQQNLQVPLISKGGQRFEAPSATLNNCRNTEFVLKILNLLKNLVSQGASLYIEQPEAKIQVLNFLKQYLESASLQNGKVDIKQNFKELFNPGTTPLANATKNLGSYSILSNENLESQRDVESVLKYLLSDARNEDCKEALTAIIQSINNAQSQLMRYCKYTGICNINKKSDYSNVHRVWQSILSDDRDLTVLKPSHGQISTNSHQFNSNNWQTSINNLMSPPYQTQPQKQANDEILKPQIFPNIEPFKIYDVRSTTEYLVNPAFQVQAQQSSNNDNLKVIYHTQPEAHSNINQFSKMDKLNSVDDQSKISNDLKKYIKSYFDRYLNLENFRNSEDSNLMKLLVEKNHANKVNKPISFYGSELYKNTPQRKKLSNVSFDVSNLHKNMVDYAENLSLLQNSLYAQNFNPMLTPRYSYNDNNKAFQKQNPILNNAPNNAYQTNLNRYDGGVAINRVLPGHALWSSSDDYIKQLFNSNSLVPERDTLQASLNLKDVNYNFQGNAINENGNHIFQKNPYASSYSGDYHKQGVYDNTLLHSQHMESVPNLVKLNSVTNNNDVVELTYMLRHPQYLLYKPFYFVKYRLLFKTLLEKALQLSENSQLRSDPMSLYKELPSISSVAEVSPDLRNYEYEELAQFIKNYGTLVSAQVLIPDHPGADKYLNTVRNLNAKLNANDTLNVIENDTKISPDSKYESGILHDNQSLNHAK